MSSKHILWHESIITKEDRQKLNEQKSAIIWFTGLSGSGKSTLSVQLEKRLFDRNIRSYRLDGDNIRHGLNNDLSFSPDDRTENIRRIGEVSKLFVDSGILVLTAFISPYKEDRQRVRDLVAEDEFIEVYVKASLSVCEKRDPKGLYKKARSGVIKNFTGIDAPYEKPNNAEIVIETDKFTIDECVDQIIKYLEKNHYI